MLVTRGFSSQRDSSSVSGSTSASLPKFNSSGWGFYMFPKNLGTGASVYVILYPLKRMPFSDLRSNFNILHDLWTVEGTMEL